MQTWRVGIWFGGVLIFVEMQGAFNEVTEAASAFAEKVGGDFLFDIEEVNDK